MRIVDPKLEIPAIDLTDTAIAERLEKVEGREINRSSTNQLTTVCNQLFSATSIDVKKDVDKIYRALDHYMSANISRYLVCRKGCGYCCAIPVDLSLVEAARIAIYLKKELPDKPNIVTKEMKNTPCPFLGDDFACSIYPVRPMTCRLFGAHDHWHNCRDGKTHLIHTHASQPAFTKLEQYLEYISAQIPNSSINPVIDIRELFTRDKPRD